MAFARHLSPLWFTGFKAHTIVDFITLKRYEAQRGSNEIVEKALGLLSPCDRFIIPIILQASE